MKTTMKIFSVLTVAFTVHLVTAHQRLRLTVLKLDVIGEKTAKDIVSIVNNLDNPKIEASISGQTKRLIITTEDEGLRINVTKRIMEELDVAKSDITVEKLPDIEITDSYRLHKRSVEQFNIKAFNTYESINNYLEELASANPDFVTSEVIGYSFHNRPIRILKISATNGAIKPKIFMEGGQHAREWISPAVVLYLAHQLIEGYKKKDGKILHLVNRYEFHIVPILNPDGYIYTYAEDGIRLWRKNRRNSTNNPCAGVDLNRNWDFHWSGRGGSTDKCSLLYQGESAFSEEETMAAAKYILAYPGEWHSYFSFHSFGQLILYPYSHTFVPSPDFHKHYSAGLSMAEGVKSVNNNRTYNVGSVGMILYEASGSSESWAYSIGVPYTYTIELPDRSTFVVPTEVIEPAGQELIAGFIKYIQHVEKNDPDVYDEIVANITMNLPPPTTTAFVPIFGLEGYSSASTTCAECSLILIVCIAYKIVYDL